MTFVLVSKLYRQMYANTGITADSARYGNSTLGNSCLTAVQVLKANQR